MFLSQRGGPFARYWAIKQLSCKVALSALSWLIDPIKWRYIHSEP